MHKRLSGRVLGAFERFFRVEAASGIVLLGAALLALWWANSPFGPGYEALWHTPWRVAGFTVSLHF
jgi:NhaA family Na+:H+ antiporter